MRVYTEEKERGDNTSAESETPKKIDKEERGKDKTKKGKFVYSWFRKGITPKSLSYNICPTKPELPLSINQNELL